MNKIALIIPTLNGGPRWQEALQAIDSQTLQPDRKLVIDSGSDDATADLARQQGFEVITITRQQFNHGATRQQGADHVADCDILVYLTQDAVLDTPDALQQLVSQFANPHIGAAYGRQLPHTDAGPFGSHARQFNYPAQSRVKSIADAGELGIKTPFLSNSFAAYRRAALQQAGGFPTNVILAEDMIAAARMLQQGWHIAYVAEAAARHSHDYTLLEEFRRYFDTGVLHTREPWLLQAFGTAEKSGGGFVRSELAYLRQHAFWLIPQAMARNALKYAGYRLGKAEARLPRALKPHLSMHKRYWQTHTHA